MVVIVVGVDGRWMLVVVVETKTTNIGSQNRLSSMVMIQIHNTVWIGRWMARLAMYETERGETRLLK